MKLLRLNQVFFVVSFVFALDREWHTYFEKLQAENVDLSDSSKFAQFQGQAKVAYPDSSIFKAKNLYDFLVKTIKSLATNDDDQPGLPYASHICKYFPLPPMKQSALEDILPEPIEDAISPTNYSSLLEICKNLDANIPAWLSSQVPDQSRDSYRLMSNVDIFVDSFKQCKIENLSQDLSVRNLALFLADGALSDELDLEGNELEHQRADFAACALAQFLHEAIKSSEVIAKEMASKFSQKFVKLAAISSMLSTLKDNKSVLEIFEQAILQLLRELEVGEDLLLGIGFIGHAMAMAVEKIGPRLYDIYVFNSGSGLEHHSSVVMGERQKYFPAKLYKNVPLSKLKTLGFFQKIAEFIGVAHVPKFPNIEEVQINTDAKTLYKVVLSCLVEYEYEFTEQDSFSFALITSQRAGTCAMRALLAYMSHKLKLEKKFKLVKLTISKLLFDQAWAKQWSPSDKVILARFMKFGIENYARSLIKFMKNENTDNIPLSAFWNHDIISMYKRYSAPYAVGRPRDFRADTENAEISFDFFEKLMEQSASIAKKFEAFDEQSKALSIEESPECKEWHKLAFQPFTGKPDHIEAVHAYVSKCWTSISDDHKLAFLLTTVLHHWPMPSRDQDVYDILLPADNFEVCEKNMQSLFKIVQLILKLSLGHNRGEYAMFAAHIKILAIYQKAFSRIYPEMEKVKTHKFLSSSMTDLFTCPDAGVFTTMDKIFFWLNPHPEFPFAQRDEEFYAINNTLRPSDCALHRYIESIHDRVDWEQKECKNFTNSEKQLNGLFNMRLKTKEGQIIPPHHYFWRIMAKIVFFSGYDQNDRPSKFPVLPNDFDPLHDKCQLEYSSFKCESDKFKKELDELSVYSQEYNDTVFKLSLMSKPDSIKSSRSPVIEHLYKKDENALTQQKQFGFCDAELPVYWNTIRTDEKMILRKYIHLVQDVGSSLNWASLVYLGLELVNKAFEESELLGLLLDVLQSKSQKIVFELMNAKKVLESSDNVDPKVLLSVNQLSGMLVLQAATMQKLGKNGSVQDLRKEISNVIDVNKINGVYATHLMLGYILSIQNGEMSNEEAKFVVSYNSKLEGLKKKLNFAVDQNFYMFSVKIIVSKALFVLEKLISDDPSNLDIGNSKDEIVQISLPWIECKGNKIINVVTGGVFIGSFSATSTTAEAVEELAKRTNIQYLPKLDYSSITKQGKGNDFLTTATINESSRPQIKLSDQQHTTLIKLDILESGNSVDVRGFFSNDELFYLLKKADIDWAKLPFPAPKNSEKKYTLFANPFTRRALAFDNEETFWLTNGAMNTVNNRISDLNRLLHDDTVKKNALRNPLSPADETELFKTQDSYALNLNEYADAGFKSLWFQLNKGGQWILNNEQRYFADPDQTFKGCSDLIKYLVIRTEGSERKILLPIQHFEVEKKSIAEPELLSSALSSKKKKSYEFKFSSVNKDSKKRCLQIPLSSSGTVHPESRLDTILLAYHYLVARRYVLSFNMLRRVHQMEELGAEELRILAWIMFSNNANKDGSPESTAVRSYVSFIVMSNSLLYGHLPKKTDKDGMQCSRTASPPPDPYSKPSFWPQFWADQMDGVLVSNTVDRYFELINKIPKALRLDVKSKRGIITDYEEGVWLGNLRGANIRNYDGRGPSAKSTQLKENKPIESGIDLPVFLVSDIDNGKLQTSYSRVHSFQFSDLKFKETFFGLLLKEVSEDRLFDLSGYLQSLQNTYYGQQAFALREAIFSRKDAQKIRQNFRSYFKVEKNKPTSIKFEKLGFSLAKYFRKESKEAKHFKLPGQRADPDQDDVKNMALLATKWFEDADLGLQNNIADFKFMLKTSEKSLIDAVNDSSLYPVTKYFELELPAVKGVHEALERLIEIYATVSANIEGNIRAIIDGSRSREWTLERIAWGIHDYDFETLIHLYAHADHVRYKQYIPEFDMDHCQDLHDQISKLVLAITNLNDLRRLQKAYNNKDKDPVLYETELSERIRYSSTSNNVIMAYEVFINSRLTKQQVNDIARLSALKDKNFSNYIVQRIMSAGKTFILGTILAFLKADRHHLSVLVVPKSLYTRESANLIRRTMNAFGSEGFSFKVSRTEGHTASKSLEWIAQMLEKSRSKGEYVILPPETLLTLLDKSVEYAMTRNENKLQLNHILKIFKSYGAGTFDEIDLIFPPTQELNFPIPTKENAEELEELKNQAYMICEIFNILDSEEIFKNAKIRKNIEILPTDYVEIKKLLAERTLTNLLKNNLQLPIKLNLDNVKSQTDDVHGLLNEFLSADGLAIRQKTVEFFERYLDPASYRLLCVARMLITTWLPVAWQGNVNEHYGLSEDTDYAIPYSSSGVPKKGSEFSIRWLTYVRTIRTYLVSGFDERTIKAALLWLQKMCLKEIEESGKSGNSLSEKLLMDLFEETPYSLDLDKKSSVAIYLKKAKELHAAKKAPLYTLFLYKYLSESVIPSVKYYHEQISANAQDFTYMFDTIQGYSGTIYSVRTLPPYFLLPENRSLDEGIEGEIADKIKENSNFEVVIVESGLRAKKFFESKSVIVAMENMQNHPFNGIIDVGAYFKDEPNESVASAILDKQDGVFYFSSATATRSKLALIIKDEEGRQMPEKILESMSRDSIENTFKDSNKRATYYDQPNTTGVDIFQHDDGYAIVILGLKTTSRDFFQAVMRMRKLLVKQRVILVLPEMVEKTLRSTLGVSGQISVTDVIQYTMNNMRGILKQLNGAALVQMIRAKFKSVLLDAIISGKPGIQEEHLKITIKATDLPLAAMVSPQSPKEWALFIDEYIESCKAKIWSLLVDPKKFMEEVEALRALAFGHNFKEHYEPEILSCTLDDSDQMVENEAEAQAQNLVEVCSEIDDGYLGRSSYSGVDKDIDWFAPEFPGQESMQTLQGKYGALYQLDEHLNSRFTMAIGRRLDLPKFFSENVYITPKASCSEYLFGSYRLFIMNVLFLQKGDDRTVVIIADSEIKPIQKAFKKNKHIFGYAASILDPTCDPRTVSMGSFDSSPENMRLMCEVLIFAGSTEVLEDQKWSDHVAEWVNVDKALRSAFYSHVVLSNLELRRLSKCKLLQPIERNTSPKFFDHHDFMLLYGLSNKVSLWNEYLNKILSTEKQEITKVFELALTSYAFGFDKDKRYISLAMKIATKECITNDGFLNSGTSEKKTRLIDLVNRLVMASNRWSKDSTLKLVTKLLSRWESMSAVPELGDLLATTVQENIEEWRSYSNNKKVILQFFDELKRCEFWKRHPHVFLEMIPANIFEQIYEKDISKEIETLFNEIKDEDLLFVFMTKLIIRFGTSAWVTENKAQKRIMGLFPDDPDPSLLKILYENIEEDLRRSSNQYNSHRDFKEFSIGGKPLSEYAWFNMAEFLKGIYKKLKTPKEIAWFAFTVWDWQERPRVFSALDMYSFEKMDSEDQERQIAEARQALEEHLKNVYGVDLSG